VSVKLTPEICINKPSSNNRLTAAGRWATASDSHSQNCLQTLFFLSLPLVRQQLNYTCMQKNLLKLYCMWTLNTLWGFFFVLSCFVLLCSPLMRQQQSYFWDTISMIGDLGTNTKIIKTATLLHLNLEIFYLFIYFSFIYFNFHFIFYFQSSLCLSKDFSDYSWLVHYLFLYLWSFFVCFFVLFFSTCLFIFPFSFNFFAFHPLSPLHSKYQKC
jgi:hypothetical protein